MRRWWTSPTTFPPHDRPRGGASSWPPRIATFPRPRCFSSSSIRAWAPSRRGDRRRGRRLPLRRARQRRALGWCSHSARRRGWSSCSEPKYARSTISRTFEGRDRFAPAAGWIARGTALGAFGRDGHRLSDVAPAARFSGKRRASSGEVVRVDRFGNLISNIDQPHFEDLPAARGSSSVDRPESSHYAVVATYAEAPAGRARARCSGSSDHLEIAVNGGSAAARSALVVEQP